MFWNDLKKPAAAIIALAIAASATAAAAETLVVRSTGPSSRAYPPGRALADDARITLRDNDVVVVLAGRGTRTLRGPGTFNPSAASTERASQLSAALGNSNEQRRVLGTSRGVGGPNIWLVDTTRSTTTCVADQRTVRLWRPAGAPASATITAADGRSASVQWAEGIARVDWPAALQVADGAEYRLSWATAGEPTTIRFALLGAANSGLTATVQSLIQHGCDAQLDMLIDLVSLPEPAPAPAG